MHSCGGFDFGCQIGQFLAPFWFWIQVGFWIVVALLALWGLNALKNVAGWPGVVAAITAAAAGAGYVFGRKSVTVAHPSGKPRVLTTEQIMALQRALAARQLYPGAIDGKFGAQSTAGLKAFQRGRGEAQTGVPTIQQLRDLGINIIGA